MRTCIFKAAGGTLRIEPNDEVVRRHLTKQSRHRRESASKQWLRQQRNVSIQFDSVKRLSLGPTIVGILGRDL